MIDPDDYTSEDLTDDVIRTLNEIDGDELPIKFKATSPVAVELVAEAGGFTVHVWPYSESEDEPFDRGGTCRCELVVDVYVHGGLDEKVTRRKAIKTMRVLRRSLEETEFTGFMFKLTETVNGIFDNDVLKLKGQFVSMFRATYFNFR